MKRVLFYINNQTKLSDMLNVGVYMLTDLLLKLLALILSWPKYFVDKQIPQVLILGLHTVCKLKKAVTFLVYLHSLKFLFSHEMNVYRLAAYLSLQAPLGKTLFSSSLL